jgi:hypothetical protein
VTVTPEVRSFFCVCQRKRMHHDGHPPGCSVQAAQGRRACLCWVGGTSPEPSRAEASTSTDTGPCGSVADLLPPIARMPWRARWCARLGGVTAAREKARPTRLSGRERTNAIRPRGGGRCPTGRTRPLHTRSRRGARSDGERSNKLYSMRQTTYNLRNSL